MQRRARGLLQRFQVKGAGLAPGVDDHPQQPPDFGTDAVLDRAERFFLSGVGGSARSCAAGGRSWQIRSLTSTSSAVSCWKRRNAATSRSALRTSAGAESVSGNGLAADLVGQSRHGAVAGMAGLGAGMALTRGCGGLAGRGGTAYFVKLNASPTARIS